MYWNKQRLTQGHCDIRWYQIISQIMSIFVHLISYINRWLNHYSSIWQFKAETCWNHLNNDWIIHLFNQRTAQLLSHVLNLLFSGEDNKIDQHQDTKNENFNSVTGYLNLLMWYSTLSSLGHTCLCIHLDWKIVGFFVFSTYNINHSVNKSYKENLEAKRTATLEKDSPNEEVITTRFCQKDNQV